MALFDFLKRKKRVGKDGYDMRYRQNAKEEARRREEQKTDDMKSTDEKSAKESKMFVSDRASRILIHPSVTEKSTRLAEKGTYTFRVQAGATKNEIRKAIEELYRVRVKGVHVSDVKPKRRVMRGRYGTKAGFQKAIVMLQKGEKIEFV